jgi:hypothetical protein
MGMLSYPRDMEPRSIGLLIAALGAGVAVLGLLIYAGALSWFGRLPGDIRIEGETTRIYIPIASMLVISVVLTLIVGLIRRFL